MFLIYPIGMAGSERAHGLTIGGAMALAALLARRLCG